MSPVAGLSSVRLNKNMLRSHSGNATRPEVKQVVKYSQIWVAGTHEGFGHRGVTKLLYAGSGNELETKDGDVVLQEEQVDASSRPNCEKESACSTPPNRCQLSIKLVENLPNSASSKVATDASVKQALLIESSGKG